MKKIIYTALAISVVLFSSCEDALDTKSYTTADTSNYPQKLTHAQQILAGVYNNLNVAQGNPATTFFMYSNLASDDMLGGGGDTDYSVQAEDLLCSNGSNMNEQFWKDRYSGINRANNAIATIPNCQGFSSDNQKNQMLGEAYFLRAFYYYELASMYGKIPLILDTATGASDVPQASSDSIWGSILQDCKTAIDMMPSQSAKAQGLEDGHVDKYAAEALLGRAYLFYTGFYKDANPISDKKTDVTLLDGTTLTYSQVCAYIDDCVNNSGYSLADQYQDMWGYTNKYTKDDANNYYMKNLMAANPSASYKYYEDDGGVNPEAMFKIKYNTMFTWSTETVIGYCNEYCLFFGMRDSGKQDWSKLFPFGQGWGHGPVATNLWNDWKSYDATLGKEDPRRAASVCDVTKEISRVKETDFIQETDYYCKKLSPYRCTVGGVTYNTFESYMYGGTDNTKWIGSGWNDYQLGNIHDLVLIRFADVLLMQSELEASATGINKVRTRAGLPVVGAYSFDILKKERRFELAFEGTRWNDIRRWGEAAADLDRQLDVSIYIDGKASTNKAQNGGYSTRYNATKGFAKIPESQISLSKVMKQNDGWSAGSDYNGWTK